MILLVCPEGHNLTGTLERLSAVAEFAGHVTRDQHGKVHFEYGGWTEVDWDSQMTVTTDDQDPAAGEILFVCDNGDSWPASKLIGLREFRARSAAAS